MDKIVSKAIMQGKKECGTLDNYFISKFMWARGEVYGHPTFHDGCSITTSEVKYIDENKKYIITRNSIYYLGNKYKLHQ